MYDDNDRFLLMLGVILIALMLGWVALGVAKAVYGL